MIDFAMIVIGLVVGRGTAEIDWFISRRQEARITRERREEDARRHVRQAHDQHRVSVARPDTRPARISRASVDMGASHIGQSHEERPME